MTVSRDTYISRMLSLVGWQTAAGGAGGGSGEACAGGDCARPNAPGARYPSFRWSEALVRQLDLVLLASEPYRFTEDHADALERQLGMPVLPIDGEMVSRYGSRAIDGIAYGGLRAPGLRAAGLRAPGPARRRRSRRAEADHAVGIEPAHHAALVP